jgi:FtsH-binding integral membrane protein
MDRQQQSTEALIKGTREAIAGLLLLLTVLAALLLQIIAQVLNFLAMFARPIFYVLMVGSVVLAIFITLPIVHAAYGGDVPAMLPAAAVCLLPIVISLGSGKGLWTLFAAAGEIFGVGVVIQAADLLARGAIVSTAIGAIVAYEIFNLENNRDEKDPVVNHAGHSEIGAVTLHSESDTGPVSTDFRP